MNIAIVTDSTCDWSPEEYEQNNVVMVPLKIQVGEQTLLDQVDSPPKNSTTACRLHPRSP